VFFEHLSNGVVYRRKGNIALRALRGEEGRVRISTEHIQISGNVAGSYVGPNGEEMRLSATRLWLENEMVRLAGRVVIVRDRDRIWGDEARLDHERLTVRHATVSRALSPQPATLKGKQLIHDMRNNVTHLRGAVVVQQGGKQAKGDHLVYFPQKGQLKLRDHVYLKKEADWVACQEVYMDLTTSEFTVSGDVAVRIFIEK